MNGPDVTSLIDVSVVVPLFNEEDNLLPLIGELRAVFDRHDARFEAILVDDGSTDGSWARLLEASEGDERFRALRHDTHRGQSAALLTGFESSEARFVITLDADLQNVPADIPCILEVLEECDLVSGIRLDRQDSWSKRASSRIANTVRNWVLHDGVHDVGCSLKGYRRELLHDLPLFEGLHRFLPALLKARGARILEVPVRHRPRLHGESKYDISGRLRRGIVDLVRVRRLINDMGHAPKEEGDR